VTVDRGGNLTVKVEWERPPVIGPDVDATHPIDLKYDSKRRDSDQGIVEVAGHQVGIPIDSGIGLINNN